MFGTTFRDILIPVVVAFLLTALTIISRPLSKLDRVWSDIALTSQNVSVESDYLIIDITLEDAKKFGGLPLSRSVIADALDLLKKAGGKKILVDMTLSERLSSKDDITLIRAMSEWGSERLAIGKGTDSKFTIHATEVDLRLQPDADGWTRSIQLSNKDAGLNPAKWLATGEHSRDKANIDLRYNPVTLQRISLSDIFEKHNLDAKDKRIILSTSSALVPTRLHLPIREESGRATVMALGSQSVVSGFQGQFETSWRLSLFIAFLFTLLGIGLAKFANQKRLLFVVCLCLSFLIVILNMWTLDTLGGQGHPALQYSCLLIGILVSICYRLRLIQMIVSFLKGNLSPEEAWAWRTHEHAKFPVVLFNAMGKIRRTNTVALKIKPWLGDDFFIQCMNELRQGSDTISVLDENDVVHYLSIERPNHDIPILILRDVTETARKFDALEANRLSLEHTVSTLRDSENRAIERAETFEQKQVRAEEKSKLKTEFLANMSHELRTPLNAINGFSDILQRELFGPLGDPRYKQFAGDILFSGQHLLSLINDILDLSKIEAGKMELNVQSVQLDDLISQSIRMLEMRAREVGLKLIYQCNPLPSVIADPRLIKQVVINLMTNAIKFTPNGGVVQIQTEARATDLVIHISDSGIGIPEADIHRLAQPFEQVNNEETNNQEGTGLGLSLSRSMVELHGGLFQIRSVLGRGTTVSFTVPYQQAGHNVVGMAGTAATQAQKFGAQGTPYSQAV